MAALFPRLAVAALALIGLATSLWHLHGLADGLVIAQQSVGGIPITVFRQAIGAPAPVVVIAHGFAGSQQLMQPFATTLARNGYVAVTFDFPGHGRNPNPLAGGLADPEAMQRDLLATLAVVSRHAVGLAGSDGRLAILGHSMAADVVVRYASANPEVLATVAVSLFPTRPLPLQPSNLLIIDGALEAAMLREQGYAIIGTAIGKKAEAGITYGAFADGSARRLAFSGGVEHIGVLYGADGLREALAWFNQAFNRNGSGFIDGRGHWLALLFFSVVALGWPLAGCLPRAASPLPTPTLRWRQLFAVVLAPALLTPLLLCRLPTDFLPILLGDYLTLHFALYGALTVIALWLLRGRLRPMAPMRIDVARFAVATLAVAAYSVFVIGLSLDHYVVSFMPGPWRLPLVAAVMAGTLPYFVADEWLTRRLAPTRCAYAATKLCFLLSLLIAIALNLEKLFFLVIIVPAILTLFLIYGIFSAWVHRRTRHPLVAATANAFVFAWFIAVTFPVVNR